MSIKELKDDHSRVALTADNGVAMGVMDREDYINKAHQLLSDTNTYKPIPKDPTSKCKNKLVQTLRDIKTQGGFSDSKYKRLYPTSTVPPSSMVYLKYINLVHSLRPIICSRESITYGVVKELANIISHLVDQSPHHLKTPQHFEKHISKAKVEPEVMDPSINIVKCKLQQDPLLSQRTNMSISQIVSFLEFCLKNTYLLFQDKYYEQVLGAALGCPTSPLIANLFMEVFEVKAICSAPHPSTYG